MNIALVSLYILYFIGLLIAANEHGKKKEGTHNFWSSVFALIVQLSLIWWALGWQFW